MTVAELSSVYQERVAHFTEFLDRKKVIISRVSNARLITALVLLATIYFSFQNSVYLVLLFAAIMLFVFLVRWHSVLFAEKAHLENLVAVNKNELAALRGDYSAQSPGNEFSQPLHAYASDLDLFGEASVYQYLNRACTASGEQMLAGRLLSPLSSAQEIINTQQAVSELAPMLEFRQHMQASGMLVKDTQADRAQLRAWAKHPYILYSNKFSKYFLLILPILTVGALALSFFVILAKPIGIFLVLVQWTITGFYFKRTTVFHDYVSRKKEVLEHYARLLKAVNEQKFKSDILTLLQQSARQAEVNVSKLASLMGALDARLNFLTSLVVNALIMYDLQCVYRLEKWKMYNATYFEKWIDAIGEMEVLNSLSTHAFNNATYCYPSIADKQEIRAVDIGHPLLSPQERISNSVQIGAPHTVLVVTGANMAGKSTFLRTLGVNLIFALNGAPVCAREFACPVIRLRTGMRTTDSLKDHQSYFYAELHRLKAIMDELREGKKVLVLLDEILKGTNSTDKLTGSFALVKQLLQHSCLAVIATHDLALGELENEFPDRIINYHFEPNIERDELSFDYRLKRGIAEKMNATFLMRKMGIV